MLGYQNWCGHLGASLDRDFASPGLLGVRRGGPAGGDTFRDPVAEPRPGFRSRAYVSGPSAGRAAEVAPISQVRSLAGFSTIRPGAVCPKRRAKKRRGNGLSSRDLRGSPSSYARTKWAISWSRAASPMAAASSGGMGDLGNFMGSVVGKQLARYPPRPRWRRSATTGRGASWALATTAARCNWRRLRCVK